MLRGMHFQAQPKPEIKLIRCATGAVYDVLVDVRRHSSTFGQWEGFELSAANRHTLYVPEGIAHGFQCMIENSELSYHMSEFYFPDLARGIRWDDPQVGIRWPLANPILSGAGQRACRRFLRQCAEGNPSSTDENSRYRRDWLYRIGFVAAGAKPGPSRRGLDHSERTDSNGSIGRLPGCLAPRDIGRRALERN